MNPLDSYPAARKALYAVQWFVNGVLVVAGAVFLVQQTAVEDLPRWYVLAGAIGPVLWSYLGITAQTNVQTPAPPARRGDRGAGDLVVILLVVIVVVALLLLFGVRIR